MSVKLATRLIEPDYWTTPLGPRERPAKIQTFGPEVCDMLAAANFAPDPQQELLHDLTFAMAPDMTPLAFMVAAIAARQNVKTGWLIGACTGFIHLDVLGIPEVMYTAHKMDTAHDALTTLSTIMMDSPVLSRHMLPQKNHGIYEGKDAERIELKGRRTIWFKTRTNDGGRGLARKRVLLDEYFAAKPQQVGSLIPTMGAQGGMGQLLAASSAPKADSELLHDLMKRGRAGTSPRMAYCEWCAPEEPCYHLVRVEDGREERRRIEGCEHPKDAPQQGIDCALDREVLLLHANPAAVNTDRMTLQTLKDFRQEMPPAEFARECLGWAEKVVDGADLMFGPGRWKACASDVEFPEAPAAIGLGASVNRGWASIAAAAMVTVEDELDEDGEPVERVIVAENQRRADMKWLVAEAKRIQETYDCVVVADEKGPVADLRDDFDEADVSIEWITLAEYAEACGSIYQKVRSGELLHSNGEDLNDAASGADWRYVSDGGVRVFGRNKSMTDIDMLEAAACAVKGAEDFGVGIW